MHTPVLLNEVVEMLQAAPGRKIIDATYGEGGHTRALLDKGATILAIDRDTTQIRSLKLKAEPVVLPIFVDVKKIQSAKVKIDLHQKYPEYDFIILVASRLTKEKNVFRLFFNIH